MADVIAFALRPDAVPETIAGLPPLAGRVVIDAMNRLDQGRSTSQALVELLPGARVIRAFNTIGFENLRPARERVVPGDDSEATALVLGLAAELGFRPEVGPLANAIAILNG